METRYEVAQDDRGRGEKYRVKRHAVSKVVAQIKAVGNERGNIE